MRRLFLCSMFLGGTINAQIADMTSENWKNDVMCEVIKRAEDEKLKTFWVGIGEPKNNKLLLTIYFWGKRPQRLIRWEYDCANDTLEKIFNKYETF